MMIVGVIAILCFVLFFGLSVPLSFGVVLLFMGYQRNIDPSTFLVSGHWGMNTIVLLAIPLFILAGGIMNRGKIAEPLVDLADLLVGRFKGGLSASAVLASAAFGAISGSAAATLTCIGSVMLPRLRKANYPPGFSAALLASAAPLGLLIPPSSIQIIYAWITRQSVLKCFLATVVPGLILVFFLCVVNFVMMSRQKGLKTLPPRTDFPQELKKRSKRAFPALMMPVIILGGIYGGIMTPTEAAGIAILYAIPVGFYVYKGLDKKTFVQALVETSTMTGAVMVMFFMVMIVSRLMIFEDIPGIAEEFIFSLSENPIVVMMMLNIVLIMIGMLMDDVSGMLLSAPLLLPIAQAAGVDPIHFAAIIGVNLGMGNITPPTAPLLYMGSAIGQTPVSTMLKPTFIMIIFAWLPTLLLTTYVPAISLALPELLMGK